MLGTEKIEQYINQLLLVDKDYGKMIKVEDDPILKIDRSRNLGELIQLIERA